MLTVVQFLHKHEFELLFLLPSPPLHTVVPVIIVAVSLAGYQYYVHDYL